jgi:AcrR family transcriptional regulator
MLELQEAALALFQERGFAGTSVDEIAARANVSRSTFFRYFGSKEAVLFAEQDDTTVRLIELLLERPAEEGSVQAFERALLRIAEETAPDERRGSLRVLDQVMRDDPALQMRRVTLVERSTNAIAAAFATRKGRSGPGPQDRLAAAVCIATTEAIGHDWRENDPEVDDAIRRAFVQLREVVSGEELA